MSDWVVDYLVQNCELRHVRPFIERLHYSHSVNGIKVSYCFRLLDNYRLIGAAIFGQMSTTAWKKFGQVELDVIELRRLACVDEAPRNTESYFVGAMLRWLRRRTQIKVVVSYADPNYGHTGIIYRASNFQHVGMSQKDYAFRDRETGAIHHSRALRTKYNGDYKPFVKRLRQRLADGLLEKVELLPKHCYVFRLRR